MQNVLLSLGKTTRPIYNHEGTLIANGYERIVIGDYGAYIEFKPEDINRKDIHTRPDQKYRESERYRDNVKYFWLETKDESHTKIYYQRKTVKYADYKVGMCYVSPDDCAHKI